MNSLRKRICTVIGSLLLSPVIGAQDASTEDLIEEIFVTATKRAENLQTVPIAITAISGDELENRGITNLAQASFSVPNLKLNHGRDTSSQATIHIRGVGQSDEHGDPGVGIYVDGVFHARSYGALFDLYDVERIEVLRGPQGTLFGRNTIGGAISVVTRKPHDRHEANLQIGYEEFDGFYLKGSANVPITDALATRISIVSRNSEGFTLNGHQNEALNDAGMVGGRIALSYSSSETFGLIGTIEMINDRANAPASFISGLRPGGGLDFIEGFIGPISDYVIGGPAGASVDSRPRNIILDASNDSELKVWGTALTATWDLDSVTVKSITGYREIENRIHSDLDGSPLLILDQRSEDFTQSQFSQEVQLLGESAGRMRWMAGLYYSDEEQTLPILVTLVPDLGADLDFERTVNQAAKSVAGFGSMTFDFSDQWALTLGGRYTREEKEFDALRQTIVGRVVTFFEPGISDSFTNLSPRATLDFQFSDDSMAYLTFSRGFKSGGFNTRAASSGQTGFFRPEEVDNIEFGLKSVFARDRLRLNVALFRMDYTDIQQQAFFVNSTGDLVSSVVNAAQATVQGLEAELLYAPTDNLSFAATYGYTDASFDEFIDATAGDLSDLDFQDTPKNTYSIRAAYTLDAGENSVIRLQGNYSYRSKMYFDRDNAEEIAESGFGLFNASISWLSADKGIELMLFGRNLGDEIYKVSGVNVLDDFGYGLNYYGEPRVIGARLSVRF